MELVRRRGKTVQQDDGRLRQVARLAVEEPKARNVGGLEVHKALSPHLLNLPTSNEAGGRS